MVRSRIELKCIEDVQRRRVSFCKRRAGLMKKASELSVLCNADVGVIVFSDTGRVYEFATSSIPQIISRYNRATGPSPSQAQPDLSHLLAQQEEEIRNLREEVMRLELKNMSLAKDLEQQLSNSRRICYGNANLETALTLRPPSSDADLRMKRHEMAKKESGSTNPTSQMEM